jgi:hypothetical protein
MPSDSSLSGVVDTVMGAYRADGFDAGYRRAVNDLLAEFPLVAKEFLREHECSTAELRQALRDFELRFEQHLEQAAATARPVDQYVDGGLGI